MSEQLNDAAEEIRRLLDDMLAGRPLVRSPEFLARCALAAEATQRPTNEPIEVWADRLASSLCKFTD